MTGDIEIPPSLADARDLLAARPLGLVPFQIRAQQLALQGAQGALDAAVPVVADYYVGAFLDLPTADVPVSTSMLGEWGVSMDVVVDLASNLRAQDDAPLDQVGDALVVASVAFAAAALRDPAAVSRLGEGTPVIVVPDAGHVLVGFAEDVASLSSVASVAEQVIAQTDRPVSVTPLVRSGSGWAEFEWPDAVGAEVGRMRRRWDAIEYTAAQKVLHDTYAAAGDDVLVATLTLADNPAGERITYTTLSEGVRTLIPRADLVVLGAADGRMQHVPFAAVAALDGVLVPSVGTVPDYFLAERFPAELL
ncbi:MAG: hypothetical protein QM611_06910 [Microbacterium sp.]|uniref:hypothetical protein n=1 Tax=Microbacterium sp. TaxID=51671 RepID=UPI0039E57AE8